MDKIRGLTSFFAAENAVGAAFATAARRDILLGASICRRGQHRRRLAANVAAHPPPSSFIPSPSSTTSIAPRPFSDYVFVVVLLGGCAVVVQNAYSQPWGGNSSMT